MKWRRAGYRFSLILLLFLWTIGISAQEGGAAPATAGNVIAEHGYAINNMFLFLAAVLVILMQPGFAILEAGLNAAKNTVNILFKNVMDLCLGVLIFALLGYSLMYPGEAFSGGWFGFAGFGISAASPTAAAIARAGTLHPQADFLFQVAFAATAATIVSGAVAGRMKFIAYLIYTVIITGFVYPVSGMWKWGGGWLNAMGFHDFAGSILVHAVGGFAGLAGAIVLGPRLGKFNPAGKPKVMPAHSLAFAALGCFILWVGWYGFNPGSQLAFATAADTSVVMLIAVNTTLAAAAGGVAAMLVSWIFFKKPELSMSLNGILAGLVAITANCNGVSNTSAVIIGLVAGVLVVAGVRLLDLLKIDDPVGAFPVHGLNGVWGGIATGIFGNPAVLEKLNLGTQILGSLVIPAWSFVTMLILFLILRAVGLLRVTREEELRGLDIGEHGEEAYDGFQIFSLE